MTAYLTVAEFIELFGRDEVLAIAGIGGPNSAGGRQVDEPRIAASIDRAASLADGHCLGRYPMLAELPAQDMPALLKGAVADIARWYLRDRAGDRGAVDEVVRKRYEDALELLRGIADGRIDLTSEAPGRLPAADGPAGRVHAALPASRADVALTGWRRP